MAVGTTPWTHNVLHGLVTTAFYCFGNGLFQLSVLPAFILSVGGGNFAVGFAAGLQGASNMISALPAGYLADRCSRGVCIKMGSALQFVGGMCLIASVVVAEPGSQQAYILLCIALCLQGICDGIINGPLVALMDDSCPAGRRSDVETCNTIIYEGGNSIGPLIGLAVFLATGDHWSLFSMKFVIIAGTLLAQLSVIPAWRMDDSKALGNASEAVHLQEGQCGFAGKATCCGLVSPAHIVHVMFASNLIVGLGAGMTVKFFPVFFEREGHVHPATLQAVYASLSGLTVLCTLVANRMADRVGRLQVVLPCMSMGVFATLLLGILRPYYTVPELMLPLFMVRCVVMWSVVALQGSIVADYTPKSQRGRWKALNSVTAMGWSGSAAFGGWLIDKYGYGPCFVLTGCLQACSLPLLALLLPHVARERDLRKAHNRDSSETVTQVDATPFLADA